MRTGLRGRAAEAYYLLANAGATDSHVRATVETVNGMRERVRRNVGVELEGMRMLDIGPGQQLRHMRCFSKDNDVQGIDMDVIPQDPGLIDYVEMVRRNSVTRAAKTLVRKAIGVDRRFSNALGQRLGRRTFPPLTVHRMDACAMTFPDNAFDFIYSYSVFEHIDRPEAALEEVRRVLAPGGVAYISLHLYTSHSGQHDPKMLVQTTPEAPFWPHLRPRYEDTVSPSAYLNKLRMAEWKAMFERVMPRSSFEYDRHDKELTGPLRQLRAKGELAGFDDDELLTVNFIGIWRKPRLAS